MLLDMDMRGALRAELDRLVIPAVPVVIPTSWSIGPVAAFLFPDEPVTLVDSGIDSPEAHAVLTSTLAEHGLTPGDVRRVIVTHAHGDHYGGALWLQQTSGCDVLAHQADIDVTNETDAAAAARVLLVPLGFDEELIVRNFSREWNWNPPQFTAIEDGEVFGTLRVEHHPGHTPGHVWVVHEPSSAIFVGDYVLDGHPTNAGLRADPTYESGRAPLLGQYTAGLKDLRDRSAPALFPGHGAPLIDYAALIDRRLAKSERRTRHVLEGLRAGPPSTALEVGRRVYGSRPERSWEVLADLVGRLDLLVAEGRASSELREDGVWYFQARERV